MMKFSTTGAAQALATAALSFLCAGPVRAQVPAEAPYIGVGGKPIEGAEILFDGTRQLLDDKWTYWQGPRFASSLPIKWKIVEDPVVRGGTALQTDDPVTKVQQYGTSDIVTKKAYRDFRLHIEFRCGYWGANSGVYLQNRYEIQVLDGDATSHGVGSLVNETPSPYWAYKGTGTWNAYDVQFRAARFKDGKLVEKAMVTLYFNGTKILQNQPINKVWGGANSGLD